MLNLNDNDNFFKKFGLGIKLLILILSKRG